MVSSGRGRNRRALRRKQSCFENGNRRRFASERELCGAQARSQAWRRRVGVREDAAMAVIALFVELFGSSPLPYNVGGLTAMAVLLALTRVPEGARTATRRI